MGNLCCTLIRSLSHVRQLKATGAIVSFTTNGTIMDKTLAESLLDSGLNGLSAELDAAVETIRHHLTTHPPPPSCMACAKLDGY
ncbi:MAG: hypothetical protein GQ542_20385 [Desulforhopalus sp.]|nr:hypothetical protein [Desulforhopalus sp.]